jgi:ribonuclease HII
MAVLVGIDEAGFGPLLGPLVVSSSAFAVPKHLLNADLWQILSKSTANKRKHLAGRLLITDSKKAYSKSLGIKHIQRTVLACLACLGEKPTVLTELMMLLCPDCLDRLGQYPWYQQAAGCRLAVNEVDVAIAAAMLGNDLGSHHIEMLRLKSRCLDVGHYNKMVSAVRNKADVLFSAASQLIKSAYDDFGSDDLQIIIDRQGGRVRYRRSLQKMFADMDLRILREDPAISSYELKNAGRGMRLHFVVGADERFFPVSLASMASKYLRELLVGNINRYFAGHYADLTPTAGYWKDGLRFVNDLKRHLPHIAIDMNLLVRCR